MKKNKWRGLSLIPSKSATKEMYDLSMTISDVKYILENGYSCEKSRRKQGTYEKCFDRKRKTFRVVVSKTYHYVEKKNVFVIIHVGIHSRGS